MIVCKNSKTWAYKYVNRKLNMTIREIYDEIAVSLLAGLSDFNDAMNHTRLNYDAFIKEVQGLADECLKSNEIQDQIDLSNLKLDDRIGDRTLWEWAKNLSRIDKVEKQLEADKVFQDAFFKHFHHDVNDNSRMESDMEDSIKGLHNITKV